MTSKRRTKATKRMRLCILVNVVVLFFLVIAFGREYVGNIQIEHEIAQLQEEKERLETEQLDTLDLIDQLSSEYYLESEARSKQGLGREGEVVYIIQDGEEDDELSPEELARLEEVDVSNPMRWFYYFFAPDEFTALQESEG